MRAPPAVTVDFQVAAFGEMGSKFSAPFDAVTCLGNSLPHLPDDLSLAACLRLCGASPAGGLLVIQNRNYDRS